MTTGIGDVTSSAMGSGARYNTGKPAYDLVPLHIIVSTLGPYDVSKSCEVAALHLLAMWQGRDLCGSEGNELLLGALRLFPQQESWKACAQVFDFGRHKYAEFNWAKGMSWNAVLGCAVRHLLKVLHEDETLDADSGLSHIGHFFCNIVMLITFSETYLEGDDRAPVGRLCADWKIK